MRVYHLHIISNRAVTIGSFNSDQLGTRVDTISGIFNSTPTHTSGVPVMLLRYYHSHVVNNNNIPSSDQW